MTLQHCGHFVGTAREFKCLRKKHREEKPAPTLHKWEWSPLTQEGPSRSVENVPVNKDNKQHNVSPSQLKTNTKLWETAAVPGVVILDRHTTRRKINPIYSVRDRSAKSALWNNDEFLKFLFINRTESIDFFACLASSLSTELCSSGKLKPFMKFCWISQSLSTKKD